MSNFKTPPDRRLVRLSRPYDFLYDSTYTMPSRRDFLKDSAFGARSGARVNLKSVYKSMFSEIKTDRRIQPCLTLPKPNVLDNFMPQYDIHGIPVMPADTGPLPLPRQIDDVTGANRAKYALRYSQPTYHMHQEAFDFNKLAPEEKKKILQTQKTRRSGFMSRGVQTDTRESETQTDPYSPPYKLPYPGAYPTVLALIKLTWAKGLPFTLEDIVVIERALSRRMLEHTSRLGDDEAGFEARIKLMEELEAQQWADREKELEILQQLKMEIVSKLLIEYTGSIATEHTMRLERLQDILKNKNMKHLENVKKQYFRSLRKLEKIYFDGNPTRKRNIIKDYTEFDSGIYAPLVRNGVAVDLLNPAPPFQLDVHMDFEAFNQLAQSKTFIRRELAFDMEAFRERIRKCESNSNDKRMERKLEKVLTSFKDHHTLKRLNPFTHLEDNNNLESVPRPSLTPIITMEDDSDIGHRRPYCITIQKIARGRVIQKLIRNEIEQNMNELLGMKLMFDMDPNCQRVEEGQMQKLIAMKKQSEADASKDTVVKEVLGHLEGETLNKMLDFLDKEMIRLIDERKIHALILMAERERRRKEAIEAGRRHFEEENRRSSDEIFRQVAGITQSTIDIFLEEMYIESCDRTADEISKNHVRQMAATLNEAAYTSQANMADFEQEELAAELVSSFMIPELSRLCHRENVDAAEKRYKKAVGQVMEAVFSAHSVSKQIIQDQLPGIVLENNTRGWAGADGSVAVVNDLIREAVDEMLKSEILAKELAAVEGEQKELSSSTTDGELHDEHSPTHLSPSHSKEKDVEIPVDESEEIHEPSANEAIEIVEDETLEEIPGEFDESPTSIIKQEEIPPVFYEPKLLVHDEIKERLAAKALQVALKTELGQTVTDIYAGVNEALQDIFIEARRTIVADPVTPESNEVTIDSDTDDD